MIRTRQELAAIIKSDKVPMRDYCVVDVRDDDWYGGNIKGAHHQPSYDFLSKVIKLVKTTQEVPVVVFHCALSQVRYVPPLRVLHRCYLGLLTNACLEGRKPRG